MAEKPNNVYFADVYERLAAPFEHTFKDVRGGVELEYITGEMCITRLNETLGMAGWSFSVREHGINEQADEAWALGRLEANCGGTIIIREQFGSQKVKRSRSTGNPLDIGFDLKGAATDALKKCAMGLGVGLYLSRKEEQAQRAAPTPGPAPVVHYGPGEQRPTPAAPAEDALVCADCGAALTETRFKDGTVWPPSQLAGYGRRKHNRLLCMEHYRAANEARRRNERPSEDVAF
jgi:hypothetical protein